MMKLIRIGTPGRERPAALVEDRLYVDLSDIVDDFDEGFFGSGMLNDLSLTVQERVEAGNTFPLDGERIGSPISRPHQIICVGLNYADHAEETAQEVPSEPILFTKSPNTMVGPRDDILIPPGASKLDWEVELGIVIGKRAQYLTSIAEAKEHVAGWVLVNDVSEREFQLERGGQWLKGKSAESFNPTGPFLATVDEIGDVSSLDMWLEVNGVRRQTGNTAAMIFDPFFLVHYISQFLVLEPGDLINTGTPPGVGMGLTPPVWLNAGDEIALGIDGLGEQRQTVRHWSQRRAQSLGATEKPVPGQ